jgi:hypothetical protein
MRRLRRTVSGIITRMGGGGAACASTSWRQDCAPLAGKSTLNRLELSRLESKRYHKISHNPIAIKRLLVDLFLEAHEGAPNEIILECDNRCGD